MSRQEPQGVVLTGYHSNAELSAKAGQRAILVRPSSVEEPEPTAHRWDMRVCAAVKSRMHLKVCVKERVRECVLRSLTGLFPLIF